MRAIHSPPPVWVQMSTAHIYGDPPEAVCSEESPLGYGLAPFVGRAWEEAFRASVLDSQRPVILRTSFVLGRDRGAGGSALKRLTRLTRMGLGGKIGSGKQGISWIHELDLNRLFERALVDPAMRGVYIASAPNPVCQDEFARQLRRADRHANRSAGIFVDGPLRRALAFANRSGTCPLWSLCHLQTTRAGALRFSLPTARAGDGRVVFFSVGLASRAGPG